MLRHCFCRWLFQTMSCLQWCVPSPPNWSLIRTRRPRDPLFKCTGTWWRDWSLTRLMVSCCSLFHLTLRRTFLYYYAQSGHVDGNALVNTDPGCISQLFRFDFFIHWQLQMSMNAQISQDELDIMTCCLPHWFILGLTRLMSARASRNLQKQLKQLAVINVGFYKSSHVHISPFLSWDKTCCVSFIVKQVSSSFGTVVVSL